MHKSGQKVDALNWKGGYFCVDFAEKKLIYIQQPFRVMIYSKSNWNLWALIKLLQPIKWKSVFGSKS